MSELILKRKKKVLFLDLEEQRKEQIEELKTTMVKKLVALFRKHIGREEIALNSDIFEEIYGVNPAEVDLYKRAYYWELIKKFVKTLRQENSAFIIITRLGMFVLKTQEEANKYKGMLDRDIVNFNNRKVKADEWVKKELWRKI